MRIALYQPEIAGNVGAILRIAACFDWPVEIVEPCGFAFSDRSLARAGMDYANHVAITRHADWVAFRAARPERIQLLTTHGDTRLPDVRFEADDILLFGSEGSGAPPHVHDEAATRVRIPIAGHARSLNLAVSCGIAVGEALRQTEAWPA